MFENKPNNTDIQVGTRIADMGPGNRIGEDGNVENDIITKFNYTDADRILAQKEEVDLKDMFNAEISKKMQLINSGFAYVQGKTSDGMKYLEEHPLEVFNIIFKVFKVGVDKLQYMPGIGNTLKLLKYITNFEGYNELHSLLMDTAEYITIQRTILNIYLALLENVKEKLEKASPAIIKDISEFFFKTFNLKLYSKIISKINIIVAFANNIVQSSTDTSTVKRFIKSAYKNAITFFKNDEYIPQSYKYLTDLHNDLITQNTQLIWLLTICSTLVPEWQDILHKLMKNTDFINFMNNYVDINKNSSDDDDKTTPTIKNITEFNPDNTPLHSSYTRKNNDNFFYNMVYAAKGQFDKTKNKIPNFTSLNQTKIPLNQAAGKTRKRTRLNKKKQKQKQKQKKRHSKTKKYKTNNR